MQLAKTTLGNLLEWFDFALFLYLAPLLGSLFFPTHALASATLTAFAAFTIGYLCRPLGGILFGFLGDTKGRSLALKLSILLISLATFGIGILPTFATIGIAAPILFISLRMLQGISAGGEYCGIMIYLAETAPPKQRGFFTSLAGSGSNLGFLLATISILLLQHFFNPPAMLAFAWRIPFIVLGLFGILLFYFRLNLAETNSYQYLKSQRRIVSKPLYEVVRHAPEALLKIMGLTCFSSIFYIIFFGFLPTYLAQYANLSLKLSLTWQCGFLFLMLFLIPLGGYLGDQFGRKTLLCLTTTSAFCLVLPVFYSLQTQMPFWIILAMGFATLISSFDQGNNLAAFVENCPPDVRYTGIGFAFNLGNALFGGTAPFLVSWLMLNYGGLTPAYYIMGAAVITLITIHYLTTESTKV